MWLSHRIHRRFKFTVVNVKDSCYLASSWIYTTKEELFATYFMEGTTRMIGIILCVNSGISKHCSQYRSAFQHQGSFSVLEQHLFFCSVQFSRSVMSDSLRPPLNRSTPDIPVHHQLPEFTQTRDHWVADPLSSPSPPVFNLSQHQGLFKWVSSPKTGVSASPSVLPMNTQNGFPLGWTGWISLQPKGLSRVFSNTTVQKHPFFCAQLSL